jgi:hypothetical protein
LDTVLGISIGIGNGNGNGIEVWHWHQALLHHNSAAKLSVPIGKFMCCIMKTNKGCAESPRARQPGGSDANANERKIPTPYCGMYDKLGNSLFI